MSRPLVSVSVIAYNQELYIGDCLRSILTQKCDFEFELVINDDNSKDNTSAICSEVIKEFSNANIKYQRNSTNLGMIDNWINCIERCEGKYIALCEGDDFWTDPNKLNIQAKFLEGHPEYSGCFHNTEERYEDDLEKASFLYCGFGGARSISFSDLSKGNLMPTCSVLFKNKLFGEFPAWYRGLKFADWSLHLLNAQYGDFWYIPRIMAVHRLHSKSVWALQDHSANVDKVLKAYDELVNGFDPAHRQALLDGKQHFIAAHLSPPKSKKPGIKGRTKEYLIKAINRL
jgi:glycosyltransferase involved in cell wall biosynthesis